MAEEIAKTEPRPLARTRETLEGLLARILEAATGDIREFFDEQGNFKPPRSIPRELTLLVKGLKLHRLAPVEHMDLLGLPATEVTEVRWESQADLMFRAAELLVSFLKESGRLGEALSDADVERGSLEFLALRRPDLVEKYPDLFVKRGNAPAPAGPPPPTLSDDPSRR